VLLKGFVTKLREEFSFVRGNLLTLVISWVFMFFTYSLVYPFESPYIRELGASPFIIGLMGSLGTALLCLVRIPGAYMADRYGRKQIIVTMTFGIAISYLFYVFAPDWRFILIGVVVSNLCLIYQPALQAITADSIPPKKRGMGFAIAQVIPNLVSIPAPLIAGFLVEKYDIVGGMRIAYAIVFICFLAAAIVRMLFLKETLENPRKIRLGEITKAFKDSPKAILEAWEAMSKSLKFLTMALLVSAFEEPLFRLFTALYVIDVVGVTGVHWGLVNMAWTATALIFGLPLGKFVDIFGRKRAIILAYVIFTPSSILFIFSRGFLQLLLVFVFFAIGGNLIHTAYSALQADMIPRDKRGRIMGTMGTMNLLATIPSAAIGGYLYQTNPAAPFVVAIILGVVTSLIIAFLVREPEKREE
jgi:MFS family permease